MNRLGTALACAAAAAALSAAAPAAYAEAAAPQYTLEILHLGTEEVDSVTLTCGSEPSGTHPDPDAACTEIDEAGSIEAIPSDDGACPAIYDPVVAGAEGAEEYRQEYSNRCILQQAKGAVFRF